MYKNESSYQIVLLQKGNVIVPIDMGKFADKITELYRNRVMFAYV